MRFCLGQKFKKLLFALAGLALAVGCFAGDIDKELMELYPESVIFTVSNTLEMPREDAVITIALDQLRSLRDDFNPANFVVLSGRDELPGQAVDSDGDKEYDQLVITTRFASGEQKNINIRYNPTGSNRRVYTQRAQAEVSVKIGGEFVNRKYIGGTFENVDYLEVPAAHTDHSDYIRYEGPGWESDKIGYRYYLDWRNAIDIFGKKTPTMVLQNVGQDGFGSYHEPADWGMDILKVGESPGIGAIGMWVDGKVERVAITDNLTVRVLGNGPIQAAVATHYGGWQVGGATYDLDSRLTIFAGSRMTRHQLEITPGAENLCTGLVKHPDADIFSTDETGGEWTYLASYGQQSLMPDQLGMAIIYRQDQLVKLTADEYSNVVVLKPAEGKVTYYFLAAWEQEPEGIKSEEAFRDYLATELDKLNVPLEIKQ